MPSLRREVLHPKENLATLGLLLGLSSVSLFSASDSSAVILNLICIFTGHQNLKQSTTNYSSLNCLSLAPPFVSLPFGCAFLSGSIINPRDADLVPVISVFLKTLQGGRIGRNKAHNWSCVIELPADSLEAANCVRNDIAISDVPSLIEKKVDLHPMSFSPIFSVENSYCSPRQANQCQKAYPPGRKPGHRRRRFEPSHIR